MKKLLSLISVCLLLFSFSLFPQDRILPADKDVVTGTLNNGVKYYIQKNNKPEKRAELRLYVKAGSVLENDNQQGLAHFVEHMAFNGTKNFAKNELINYLEKLGIKFGPEVNAYTGFDQTVYILTVPTDSIDILAKGFFVLEEWAHNLSFDPAEIDKERGVLIEEWRLGRGAQMRMLDKQLPILFKGSRYAERLAIGKKGILESADYQTIKDFYKDWYRPDLFAVAAVGDFNIDEIKGYIEQHFSGLTSPAGERERIIFDIPKHKDTYFAIASDVEAQYSTCAIYYMQEPKIVNSVSGYRNNLVHDIFYGMLNNRFNELTSSADPPFAYGYAGSQKFIKSADLTLLVAMVKEGGIEKGFEALLREAERVDKFGFTQTELDRQKKSLLRAAEQSLAEKDKTESSEIIRQFEMNFLFDEPLVSVDDRYNLAKEILPLITLDEVNAVASELLSKGNRVVLVNAPEKEGVTIPVEAELAAVIDKVSSEQITAYEDKVVVGPLVKDIPAPSPVISSVGNPALDIVTWTLGNGIKVILKPTNYKNDEILFNAFSPGGSSQVKDEDFLSAAYATALVEESGLEGITSPELEKYLTGKIVEVNPYIDFYSEGIRGGASPKDLETLFQLIYSYFTKPQIDSIGYTSFITKM
ncbi:MAG TPA: pitrilysin family protein, partial [Ignavibacteriaceae bacterium]|nr:pitrilysin family protein [Ignavibacteriaceae bacterium]